MSVHNNPIVPPIVRVKGNREPLDVVILDNDGAVVDCSGKTFVCRWIDIDAHTVKVNDSACTVTSGAAGEVRYTPAAGDVDTAGLFAVYFIDTSVTPNRWYPYDGARYRVNVVESWEAQ